MSRSPPPTPSRRSPGRPPRHGEPGTTRERLLHAGFEVAAAGGLRSVTVAALTERTGANAGSFVYHFGTRDAFLAELVERWYTPFLAGLEQLSVQTVDPLARLREQITALALWAGHHAPFIAHLLSDAASGEPVARRFLGGLPGRHPALILRAVRDGQAAGLIEPAPPFAVMTFLMAAVALPPVFAAGLEQTELLPAAALRSLRQANGEAGSLQRLEWALKGICLGPRRGARR
jgi:AcrR family transcriptional regulator